MSAILIMLADWSPALTTERRLTELILRDTLTKVLGGEGCDKALNTK